jgi:ferric-dicitrate binding protein FerR (iron transport regulator)
MRRAAARHGKKLLKLTRNQDRLIDTLLSEMLGGEDVPDLTARIVARAARKQRLSIRRLSLTAAALVLVGALTGILLALRYPEPCAIRSGETRERARVPRGTLVAVGRDAVDLVLGGYCRLRVEPGSEVEIRGEKRKESVSLRKGGMTCEVDRGKGTFTVITQVGTVSVTGTRFNVRLAAGGEEGGDMRMTAGRTAMALAVAVLAGSVNVQHNGETWSVHAGGSAALAAEQAGGKIEAGKPSYRAKDNEAWAGKGRIVGPVRNAPAFTTKALNEKGEVVKSFKGDKGARAYELEWLAPGVYTLEVTSEGYATLTVKGLEVKAGNDLFVVVEFSSPK